MDDNIIDLTKKRIEKLGEEFEEFDASWENIVDVTLDGHEEQMTYLTREIDRLIIHQKSLYAVIEDLQRDVTALQSVVSTIIRGLS
jgi:hypothetical protein